MGWLIALGVLVAIGFIPLGAFLRYDQDGLKIKLVAGALRFAVYPLPERKQKKPKKEKKKQPPKQQAAPKPEPEEKKGGRLQDFYPFLQLGLRFMKELRRKLCINHLVLKLTLAGDDPCDLAVNYGRAWAAVGNLLPRLEQAFVIRKREIEVQCDFQSEETRVLFGMDVTITLGRLLGLAVKYGFRAVKIFLKMKRVKAVQTNE